MTEAFRLLVCITCVVGFAGNVVLVGVYVRAHDRRAPLPVALALFLASTAVFNAEHLSHEVTGYTWVSFMAALCALWAVVTTGLYGKPKHISTTNGNGHTNVEGE